MVKNETKKRFDVLVLLQHLLAVPERPAEIVTPVVTDHLCDGALVGLVLGVRKRPGLPRGDRDLKAKFDNNNNNNK